jgi:hypothetical protein
MPFPYQSGVGKNANLELGLPLNAFKKLPLMVSRTKRCASWA